MKYFFYFIDNYFNDIFFGGVTLFKKYFVTIFIFGCLFIHCQSVFGTVFLNSTFYTGKRFGLNTVGQSFSFEFKDFKIKTDFESFMGKFQGTFFSPSLINYGTGFEYKQL